MIRSLVAFWTLFSAISIGVMVLTALAQIRPVPLGEGVVPRPRLERQALAQRNPEGGKRSEGANRTDPAPEQQGSGRDLPAGKTGRG